jgi:hypothetical protein
VAAIIDVINGLDLTAGQKQYLLSTLNLTGNDIADTIRVVRFIIRVQIFDLFGVLSDAEADQLTSMGLTLLSSI